MPVATCFSDLVVPSDAELASALGSTVTSRRELRAWPLAVTEQLGLDDGRRYVCKTQLGPTVEPEFYAAARSPLLAPCLDLGFFGRSRVVVVDWIQGSRLDADDVDAYLRSARAAVDGVAAIGGNPPVHLDLSTVDGLQGAAYATAARLRRLVEAKRFRRLSSADGTAIETWAASDRTVAAATDDAGVVHGDLSRDEVFLVEGDGPRVVDWQRPLRGPREIDLIGPLRSGGIDPEPHVDLTFLQLEAFVLLHWSVLCAAEVLPDLPADPYEAWAIDALATLARHP